MAPINSSASPLGGFLVCEALDRVSELVDKFARQRRVIVDEIQRVLDLMRDPAVS